MKVHRILSISLILILVACSGNDRATTIELPTSTEQAAGSGETAAQLEPTNTHTPIPDTPTPEPTEIPPTGTPTFTSTPTATPIAPTATPTVERVYTEEDMSEALLTINDMPTGWTQSSADSDDTDDEKGDTYTFLCAELERGTIAQVKVDFQKSQLGPMLGHSISLYPQGAGPEVFANLVEAAQSCLEWTETTDNGTVYNWELSPMSFPNLGDETLAFRVFARDVPMFGLIEFDAVYILVDDFITSVSHMVIGFDGVDSEFTETISRQVVERLEDLD